MNKDIRLFIYVIVSLLVLYSCSSNAKTNRYEEIKKTIEQERQNLPLQASPFYTITDITLNEEEEMLYMVGELDSLIFNLFTDKQAERFIDAICLGDNGNQNGLLKSVLDAEIGVSLKYKNVSTGEVRLFKIDANQIREKINEYTNLTDQQKKKKYLIMQAEIANEQCPVQVDYMTQQISVFIVGNFKIHKFVLDEGYADMNIFEYNSSSVKEQLIAAFNNPMMKKECEILKEAKMGLKFQYVGSETGKLVEIIFTPEEIASIYNNIVIQN